MVFPNFEHKHVEASLFSADDFITFRYRFKGKFPKKWIIIFQGSVERYVRRKYVRKKDKKLSLSGNVYMYRDVGIIKMAGIGSPHAATALEELISLGGKTFLIIGTAGGLRGLGVFLCTKAIRDEGTSHHYIPSGKYAYPDKVLSKKLEKSIVRAKLEYQKGISWTIDAPYRETKAEIKQYRGEGVKTVEMEASALFAVAKVRRVKIAAAFVVSDVLGDDAWDPHFSKRHMKKKLYRLFDAAVQCLQ